MPGRSTRTSAPTAALLGAAALARPFRTATQAPLDGRGLVPVPRRTSMLVHPPLIYTGLALTLLAAAIGVADLAGQSDETQRRLGRRGAGGVVAAGGGHGGHGARLPLGPPGGGLGRGVGLGPVGGRRPPAPAGPDRRDPPALPGVVGGSRAPGLCGALGHPVGAAGVGSRLQRSGRRGHRPRPGACGLHRRCGRGGGDGLPPEPALAPAPAFARRTARRGRSRLGGHRHGLGGIGGGDRTVAASFYTALVGPLAVAALAALARGAPARS